MAARGAGSAPRTRSTHPAQRACGRGSTFPKRVEVVSSRCANFDHWLPMVASMSQTSPTPHRRGDHGQPPPMREAGIAARREAAAPQSTAAIPWSTNTSIGSSSVSSIICGLAHALFDPGHSVPWSAFAGDYDRIRNAVARVTRHTSLADRINQIGRPVRAPCPDETCCAAARSRTIGGIACQRAPSACVTPVTDGAACHQGNGTAIRHAPYRRRISALTEY